MCHDVGGVGIAEESRPWRVIRMFEDLEYLARVIREGLSGPIEVDGEIYDEEMDGLLRAVGQRGSPR